MSVTDRDRGFQESVIGAPWAPFHTWCLTQVFRTRSDWEGNGGGPRVPDTTWRAGSYRLSAQTDDAPVQPPGHLSPPPPPPPPPPPTARGRALLPRVGAEEAAQGRHWCPTTVQIPGLSFLRTKRAWKLSSAPEAGTQQRQEEMSEENTTSPSPAGPELSGQWKSPATPHWSKLKHFCARPQPHLLVPTDTYEKNNSRLYMPKWTGWSWQEAP